jgi:hypothetical protein
MARVHHAARRRGAAWPLAARAQQPTMPVVGFLDTRSPDYTLADQQRAFRQGLKDAGYVEGENVVIEYRWAEDQMDRLPALAAELARRRVAVHTVEMLADLVHAGLATATTERRLLERPLSEGHA